VSRSLCQKESFDVIILIACLNGHILFSCRHKKETKKKTPTAIREGIKIKMNG
jgi:hypothetical protein